MHLTLEGIMRPDALFVQHTHHRFVLTELLCQIDRIDETLARFDEQIGVYLRPFAEAVAWLDTIPGVPRQTAEIIVSEMGTDMSRFPSAAPWPRGPALRPATKVPAGATPALREKAIDPCVWHWPKPPMPPHEPSTPTCRPSTTV